MSSTGLSASLIASLFPESEMRGEFRNQLIDALRHDPEFPAFPTVLAKLQACLNHPDTGFDKIASLIKLDPGMTARIFTLARSAAYGGVKISSLEEALWMMGLKEVRTIILATKFMAPFANLKVRVDSKKFWIHSLLTARLTYYISDFFQPVGDKEYLAGLLHDTGKLILAHYFPQKFEAVFKETQQSEVCMFEAERNLLRTDHSVVGAALCHKWGLNQDILQAIQYHHCDEKKLPQEFLPRCLYMANVLANKCEENIGRKEIFTEELPENIADMPEWKFLEEFPPRRMVQLNLKEECQKTKDSVETMLQDPAVAT